MVNTNQYFRAFQIKKVSDISLKELKRRYRILVKKYHPDKGGNAAKFRFVNDAYKYIEKLVIAHEKLQNNKFFNNKRYLFYGNGSVYDTQKGRWVKLKGVKINTNI